MDTSSDDKRQVRTQWTRVVRVSRMKPWHIPLPSLTPIPKTGGISPLMLFYGFLGIILLGSILLWLPTSSKTGDFTPFVDALFTATSATCVTGLAVIDTGTYWSPFGQAVILLLIQLGGLGFMTSAVLILLALGRRIGLRDRILIAESMGLERLGGMIKLIRRVAIFTVIVEAVGTALLYIRFSSEYPAPTALWKSTFQAVSAFNNAGFDLFGKFRSLLDYQTDTLVVLVTAALIFLGGIGFIVAADVFSARRFARLALDSKIVLVTTGTLLALGTIVILITEYSNAATLGPLGFPQKLLVSFFQSVTPRTAGFSTIDIGSIKDYTLFFTIILMFIGGASASTAGGIKVNTFGMLSATIWSTLRGKEQPGAFGRDFNTQNIYRALTLSMLSLGLVAILVLVLTITEDFSFINLLFETVSAFGTVGLSTGITPNLTTPGEVIIIVTMLIGRLGPLALVLILAQSQKPSTYHYPEGTIRIG